VTKVRVDPKANLDRIHAAAERVAAMYDDPAFEEQRRKLAEDSENFQENQKRLLERIYLEQSGIPTRYHSVLREPKGTPALMRVERFLGEPPERSYLVLTGPAGIGKTTSLAIATWRERGEYWDAQELVRLSTFNATVWDDLRSARFLALDELGSETTNSAWEANLFDLLNSRGANLRKTLLATNLSAGAFRARYVSAGLERLLDRLTQQGDFVAFTGQSLRGNHG
jgi:DNA replication protein DnaC